METLAIEHFLVRTLKKTDSFAVRILPLPDRVAYSQSLYYNVLLKLFLSNVHLIRDKPGIVSSPVLLVSETFLVK